MKFCRPEGFRDRVRSRIEVFLILFVRYPFQDRVAGITTHLSFERLSRAPHIPRAHCNRKGQGFGSRHRALLCSGFSGGT
jgi:hypothetical protein